MYKNLPKSNVNLNKFNDQYYLEKDNVIIDKACPKCGRFIVEEKDFCHCGYYLKGLRIARFWGTLFLVYALIGVFILAGLTNIKNARNFFSKEIKKNNWSISSLSPVNIQLIGSLKNTSYDGYIQSIYVKPHRNNELLVLIKPSLWNTLSANERKDLLKQLNKRWDVIYKHDNPHSTKKPFVAYANSG